MAQASEATVLKKIMVFIRKTSSQGREACELDHPGSLGKEGLRRVRRLPMYFEIQNR